MQNEHILRIKEVQARTGFSRSNIYALQTLGTFPKSIKLGERAVGWLESEITAWVAQRITTSRGEHFDAAAPPRERRCRVDVGADEVASEAKPPL